MTVREIFQSDRTAKYGNTSNFLNQVTARVSSVNLEIAKVIVRDLLDTMKYQPLCVGLAANQIGKSLRVAVIKRDDSSPLILINPILISTSGKKDRKRESCMSVWGLTGEVERRTKAYVRYQDTTLSTKEEILTGFPSRALQHEIDHLDGHLFTEQVIGDIHETNIFDKYSPTPLLG